MASAKRTGTLDQATASIERLGKLSTLSESVQAQRERLSPRKTGVARKPRTSKGELRQRSLLAATTQELARVGYRNLTVAQIAAAAGAPVGLFYRYFADKKDAVLTYLREAIGEFHATLPGVDAADFFEHQLTSHHSLVSLFTNKPGLLGCYYSYDYPDRALAAFFHDEILVVNRGHAQRALVELKGQRVKLAELFPVAHALTAMTSNFVYRQATGRDETASLEKACKTDSGLILATFRTRAYLLLDAPVPTPGLPAPKGKLNPVSLGVRSLPPPATLLALEPAAKRSPQHAAAASSYKALKEAALTLLNRNSYDDLRIGDIENKSDLTRGAIYHYFGDKQHLVFELVREQISVIHQKIGTAEAAMAWPVRPEDRAFLCLQSFIQVFACGFHASPGVLRACYQLEDRDSAVRELFQEHRRLWVRHLAEILTACLGVQRQDSGQVMVAAYALLAMLERFIYDLYVSPIPELTGYFRDVQHCVDFLAALWFRMLFVRNPPQSILDRFPVLGRLSAHAH